MKALFGSVLVIAFVLVIVHNVMNPLQTTPIGDLIPNDQTTQPTTSKRPNDETDFEQCDYLYFDLGSNIGVQIRKLFEPEKYPGAAVLPIFDQFFGPAESRRGSVCAFGFELNPKHEGRLKEIEACYRQMGWKTEFQMKAVWTADDQTKTAYRDPTDTHEDWGAGVTTRHIGNKTAMVEFLAPTVDMAAFIRRTVMQYRPISVLMKMDIEGTEHRALPHMLAQGVLCREFVSAAFIEWHDGRPFSSSLNRNHLSALMKKQPCASTKIIGLDDESYLHDNMDLPEECIGGGDDKGIERRSK